MALILDESSSGLLRQKEYSNNMSNNGTSSVRQYFLSGFYVLTGILAARFSFHCHLSNSHFLRIQ